MTPTIETRTRAPFPEKLNFLFDSFPVQSRVWWPRRHEVLGIRARASHPGHSEETAHPLRPGDAKINPRLGPPATRHADAGLGTGGLLPRREVRDLRMPTERRILSLGLKHNIDNLKSMEAISICWVEEAQGVSKNSWDKLIPTLFRIPDCELWISFNPDLESDNTYQRFVVDPPPGAVVQKLTWRDNPWFPEGLRREMEDARRRNVDEYNHIWEGVCINTLANAIYASELRAVDTENRIRRVPYDPSKPVDTAWDLGFGDMVSDLDVPVVPDGIQNHRLRGRRAGGHPPLPRGTSEAALHVGHRLPAVGWRIESTGDGQEYRRANARSGP